MEVVALYFLKRNYNLKFQKNLTMEDTIKLPLIFQGICTILVVCPLWAA
jgi:hypothetical protein